MIEEALASAFLGLGSFCNSGFVRCMMMVFSIFGVYECCSALPERLATQEVQHLV